MGEMSADGSDAADADDRIIAGGKFDGSARK